jgi:hypothetical protein
MDILDDEIESILYIAREVMGELSDPSANPSIRSDQY